MDATNQHSNEEKFVCVGRITGPQGLRGAFKIQSFTQEPADFLAYGPFFDKEGHPLFGVVFLHMAKGLFVVRTEDITTREGAESLKGTELYVSREMLPDLPDSEEDFYHADLIGLRVENQNNEAIGIVQNVEDFGAGPLLEVLMASSSDTPSGESQKEAQTLLIPFMQAYVPVVSIQEGFIQVTEAGLKSFE